MKKTYNYNAPGKIETLPDKMYTPFNRKIEIDQKIIRI